ncbi:translesion error-prone DNA polymerase V subunit UmuC [Amphritea pacifica]|uniref:translesion error-prone DNA polymerase V subunit UmuC n=1 Tax=Amphritea pacifica TaxID=2811233 RepID=UPI0019641125|nr:translesion error-prone DNA polymerase V subunit UmuC [Amphritea pacifica]
MFALVDCNNFYASCERLFRPDLQGRPIVVLSNNDGCVVARSAEAKRLGIKMAVPLFQVQEQIDRENVAVFSSNYALYGDISARVMTILEQEAPAVEVYSIDEAFLDLSGLAPHFSLVEYGLQIKRRVYQYTGIHVSVGIAPTKTLAKLANHAAKQYPATQGVVDLSDPQRQHRLLGLMPLREVWGVGRRLSRRLEQQGVTTALALADCSPAWIRSHYSVTLERTVRELNGQPCMELEACPPPRQQILCSRSFSHRITEYNDMRSAIAQYSARAAEKLREQNHLARVVTVFIRTNPHSQHERFYSNSASRILGVPSADSRRLTATALRLLKSIWQPGHRYMKAGLMLSDLYLPGHFQPSLFEAPESPAAMRLMQTVDNINHSGLGQVRFAGELLSSGWQMQRNHLSPAYTTRWDQLPVVRA